MSTDTSDRPGLRARKKARTRAEIQRAAFRLFGEQGYAATTTDQIADLADVSPGTLFRYFPTKEALVLWDELDAPILRALADQPPELPPVEALRLALQETSASISPTQREEVNRRLRLILDLPPARAAILDRTSAPMRSFAKIVAKRIGRSPDDFTLAILVGSMTGSVLAALTFAADHPDRDVLDIVDSALAELAAGLPH